MNLPIAGGRRSREKVPPTDYVPLYCLLALLVAGLCVLFYGQLLIVLALPSFFLTLYGVQLYKRIPRGVTRRICLAMAIVPASSPIWVLGWAVVLEWLLQHLP